MSRRTRGTETPDRYVLTEELGPKKGLKHILGGLRDRHSWEGGREGGGEPRNPWDKEKPGGTIRSELFLFLKGVTGYVR